MQNITVKLEAVTPLFLGGAEPRGDPELRPASFRGGDEVLVDGSARSEYSRQSGGNKRSPKKRVRSVLSNILCTYELNSQ